MLTMLLILEDDTKFCKLSITDEELLDQLLEMEKNILNVLDILRGRFHFIRDLQ